MVTSSLVFFTPKSPKAPTFHIVQLIVWTRQRPFGGSVADDDEGNVVQAGGALSTQWAEAIAPQLGLHAALQEAAAAGVDDRELYLLRDPMARADGATCPERKGPPRGVVCGVRLRACA